MHGFTLTGEQFASLESRGFEIHAPDLPGHGATRVRPVDVPSTVELLGEWLAGFEGPVPLLGYSQGGRLALLVALEHPRVVDRLILVSSSPGIQDEPTRADRLERDRKLADRIESIGTPAFLDDWLGGPIAGTAHLDNEAREADRSMRMENTSVGLASALRGLGQGSQPYVGDRVATLAMPLLTISGARDRRYERIGRQMASAAPDGRHISIEGAGHNVVLDAPTALRSVMVEFCRS